MKFVARIRTVIDCSAKLGPRAGCAHGSSFVISSPPAAAA
jgi:hypothetical protein